MTLEAEILDSIFSTLSPELFVGESKDPPDPRQTVLQQMSSLLEQHVDYELFKLKWNFQYPIGHFRCEVNRIQTLFGSLLVGLDLCWVDGLDASSKSFISSKKELCPTCVILVLADKSLGKSHLYKCSHSNPLYSIRKKLFLIATFFYVSRSFSRHVGVN